MSAATVRFRCSQQVASNSLVIVREGWGFDPRGKDQRARKEGGLSQGPPFLFGALRECRLMSHCTMRCGRLSRRIVRERPRGKNGGCVAKRSHWKGLGPLDSSPDFQPERHAEREGRSEPILTLPGALTVYILLIGFIHLRVLLPAELENWTIDVFGFIPKRYDSTLLDISFPGGEGAKVWSFVTYSLLHANLATSSSMCCGCCRSAARWRDVLAPCGFSCSWLLRPRPARSPISSAMNMPSCR